MQGFPGPPAADAEGAGAMAGAVPDADGLDEAEDAELVAAALLGPCVAYPLDGVDVADVAPVYPPCERE